MAISGWKLDKVGQLKARCLIFLNGMLDINSNEIGVVYVNENTISVTLNPTLGIVAPGAIRVYNSQNTFEHFVNVEIMCDNHSYNDAGSCSLCPEG